MSGGVERILYGNAIRTIIRAGLASTYADASERYGRRLERAGNANMVTVASLAVVLSEAHR